MITSYEGPVRSGPALGRHLRAGQGGRGFFNEELTVWNSRSRLA